MLPSRYARDFETTYSDVVEGLTAFLQYLIDRELKALYSVGD